LNGDIFGFVNRRHNLVKLFWFSEGGICVFSKRLPESTFRWPQAGEKTVTITAAQLQLLLSPGLELSTFGYSLQPEYATDPSRVRTIAAYSVNNNVGATITDVDAVGRLIDVAIGAGANRVSSITFSASDTEQARALALAEAVRSARAEAQVIAESLGYRLGAPLEIHGGAQRPTPRPMADFAMRAMQAAPTPIEAGDQAVTANVTIRFALGREMAPR
jgi:uncharacterized protein YggE